MVKKYIKGKNFMTPIKISTECTEKYIIELSEGEGFDRKKMYGVTVADYKTEKILHDISKPYYNHKKTLEYIEKLKGE